MDDVRKYQERHDYLKKQRNQWEDQWRDISDYLLPRKGFFFDRVPNIGETRHSKILDGMPTRALRILTAGLQGGLTSPSRQWFRLSLENMELMEVPMVKQWLADIEKMLRYAFAQSNFYQAAHSMYAELGGFGTGVIHIERGDKKKLHFRCRTAGEYCLAADQYGIVDTIYREMLLTARQAIQQFGDKVSKEVKKLAEKNPYEYVKITHVVQPRTERDQGKIDNQNMAWESVYYEQDHDQKILRRGGYDSFPFACPRWDVSGFDVYGRGPGMDCLPDIKTLQSQSATILKATQKSVDPPLMASGNIKGRINLLPGTVSYVEDGKVEEIIKSRPDIQAAIVAREDTRQAIREGFFNDLFLLLTQPQRDVTATEIMERKEEKMLMLGPVVERQHTEFADIVIEQSLNILMEDPNFPLLPPELMEQIGDYKIEYVSVLAQAQKMAGTQAIQRTAEFAGNLAQGFPEILDKVNADDMLDEFHEMVGAPVNNIRSDEEVAQIRAARQEAQRAQQQAQQVAMQQQLEAQGLDNQHKVLQGAKTASEALQGAANTDVEKLIQNIQGVQ